MERERVVIVFAALIIMIILIFYLFFLDDGTVQSFYFINTVGLIGVILGVLATLALFGKKKN